MRRQLGSIPCARMQQQQVCRLIKSLFDMMLRHCSTQGVLALHGGARTIDTIRLCGSGASKAKKVFKCSECGETTPQWGGKCPSCNAWNS